MVGGPSRARVKPLRRDMVGGPSRARVKPLRRDMVGGPSRARLSPLDEIWLVALAGQGLSP